MANDKHIETIEFRALAPASKTNLKGLDDALNKLNALNAVWGSLQARMSSMSSPVVFKKTAADIREAIAAAEKLGRFGKGSGGSFKPASLKPADLAKALGYDAKMFENFLTQGLVGGKGKAAQEMRRQVREIYSAATGEFRSIAGASKGVAMFTKHFDPKQDPMAALRMVFGGGGIPNVPQPVVSFADRMAAAKAAKAAAVPKPATETEGKDTTSKAKDFAKRLATIKRDLAEDLLKAQGLSTGDNASLTKSAAAEIRARQKAAKQVRGLVGGDTESKRANDALTFAAKQETQAINIAQQQALREGDNLSATRKALNKAKENGDKAEQKRLQKEVADYEKRQRNFEKIQNLSRGSAGIEDQAALALADAKHNEQMAARELAAKRRAATLKAIEDFKAQGGQIYEGTRVTKNGTVRDVRGRLMLPGNQYRMLNATITEGDATLHDYMRQGGSRGQKDRLKGAMEGMTVRNMAANILKVTEWAAAVGVLYKGLELAEYSVHRLVETGAEMAHLGLVFRGVGGDVRALTNDIMTLAAQEGRSTEEAMKSAVEWARLGGDRATVNEQVRVSAMAANIANMHMGETTKQLMSLMHIYHLETADLNGTLGMLVNTSLKYNVTLEELFTGLDRSAASAKVAGVGLSELQAMIGVVVGATGATGSTTGNAIKYIFQELNKSEVQRQLRGFGIETLGNNLEQKPAGQILGDLSGIWGTLGKRQQQGLTNLLGGRFNAARVPVLIEDYPKILKLAIDAQLNLNKAQDANVKILETLKAQLRGIRTEFDRLVMNSGTLGILTKSSEAFKYLVHDAADSLKVQPDTPAAQKMREATMRHYMSQDAMSPRRIWGVGKAAMSTIFNWGSHPEIPGLFDYWNFVHEQDEKANQPKTQEGYEQKMSGLRSGMDVSAKRVQAFGIAMKQLKNGTMTQANANDFAEIMQQMNGGQANATQFLTAFQRGDQRTSGSIVNTVNQQAVRELEEQKQQSQKAAEKHLEELQKQASQLENEGAESIKAGKPFTKQAELDGVHKALQTAKTDAEDAGKAYAALEGQIDSVAISLEKYITILNTLDEQHKGLERYFTMVPAQTAMQGLAQQAASVRAQIEATQAAYDRLNSSPDDNTLDRSNTLAELLKRKSELQSRYDAMTSPANRGLAMRQDEMQRGIRGAQNYSLANDYGIDAGAKLLNQHAALKRDLEETARKLHDAQAGSAEQAELMGRYEQEQAQLWQTKLAMAERFAAVNRDIKQLAIDQNKEFMRAFYGDGPAQMLQKLAAFRMAFNGNGTRRSPLSQGAFFGLSPEMRADYGMLNPQFNPQMIELQRERNRLKQAQDQWKNPTSPTMSPDIAGIKAQLARIPASFSEALLDIANSIKAQANPLIGAFNGVIARINAWTPNGGGQPNGVVTGGHMPANAQSGGFGGARGFSGSFIPRPRMMVGPAVTG
jgi:TP901 family phage tail tape measure protein